MLQPQKNPAIAGFPRIYTLPLHSTFYHHQKGISSSTGPSGIAVGFDCAGF